MKKFIAMAAAGLLLVLVIVGWIADVAAVVDVVQGARSWMMLNAAIGWIIAISAVVIVLSLVGALVHRHKIFEQESVQLRERAESAQAEVGRLKAELEGPRPTERDKQLAVEIMAIWDPGTHLFFFFDQAFTAKNWWEDTSTPVYDFVSHYERRHFDDAPVQASFERLYSAVCDLADWLAGNGGPSNNPDADRTRFSIVEERILGHEEYGKIRRQGRDLARQVIDATLDFEKMARARGL